VSFDYREYVENNLEGARKGGGDDEITGACPWCSKDDGHFSVNVSTGRWRCFHGNCDARGVDFAWLIAEVEGISLGRARALIMRQTISFRKHREEAPEGLLSRLQRLRGASESPQAPEGTLAPLPDEFVPVYGQDGRWSMPEYLLQREITRKAARHWGLGYCTRGRYADRIVMPFSCPGGSSFTARAAVEMRGPRYLNPEDAKHGRLVYGWADCDGRKVVVLVEGPFDVIRLWQYGIPALALLGKALHRQQLRLLCRLPISTRIITMLDPEARDKAFAAASMLSFKYRDLWISQLPVGVDPGEASKVQAVAALDSAERYTGDRVRALRAAMGMV